MTLVLIDGSGFVYRSFYALPQMTSADGRQVGAVYGFTNMMMRLLKTYKNQPVAVVFDAGKRNFRHDIYPKYKENRKETPPDLLAQIPAIKEVVRAFGLPALQQEGFEADDIIAAYCKAADFDALVVTGDKDLMQLIARGAMVFDPLKDKMITDGDVVEKFGIPSAKLLDAMALSGDTSDNVPGIAGIGPKTAAALINEYGDLENLLANADSIKQEKRRQSIVDGADMARMSKRLITLDDNAALPMPISDICGFSASREKVAAMLESLGFKSILSRLDMWLAAAETAAENVKSAESILRNYQSVTSMDVLDSALEKAAVQGFIAIDTETDGLDNVKAALIGISLAIAPGQAYYIPLRHGATLFADSCQLDAGQVVPKIIRLLEDPSVIKIGHNIKFDMHVLANWHGSMFNPVALDDTMVLAYALDSTANRLGLDNLAKVFLGETMIPFEEICGRGNKKIPFSQVSIEKAVEYAAEDADMTLRLWQLLKPRLAREHKTGVYENIERPIISVIWRMERAGVKIDRDLLCEMDGEFSAKLADLEKHIYEVAGEEFNVNSPMQIKKIFEKRGKKLSGTDAEILGGLERQGDVMAAKLLEYRQFAKLKSTYIDSLQQVADTDDRVHTSYWQTGTSTGRLSSSDPNLQNIPVRTDDGRRIRQAFVADRGTVLVGADYSQVELRILAHMADVPVLKQVFLDGDDIHVMTAAQVFGVAPDQVTKQLRARAKTINFGIVYGMSGFGLARQLDISVKEGQAFIDAYLARYPEILDYMQRTKQFAHDNGFVQTALGRKCFIQGINDRNPMVRNGAERAAINAPIQGTSADITKIAMRKTAENLAYGRLLLQVHDELLFEIPEEFADESMNDIKNIMEQAVTLSVPLSVDAHKGANWDSVH